MKKYAKNKKIKKKLVQEEFDSLHASFSGNIERSNIVIGGNLIKNISVNQSPKELEILNSGQIRKIIEDTLNNNLTNYVVQLHESFSSLNKNLLEEDILSGIIEITKRNFEKAEFIFQNCFKRNPNNTKTCVFLGLLKERNKDYRNAEFFFQKAIDINPEHTYALNRLGIVMYMQEKYDKAEEYFRKALKINSNLVEPSFSLGITLGWIKHNEAEAEKWLLHAHDIEKTNIFALLYLGLFYKKIKKDDKKVVYYLQETLRINPEFAPAYLFLGNFYLRKKNYLEAEKHLEKALEFDRTDELSWNSMAWVKYYKKEYAEAEKCIEKALEINPNDEYAWKMMASIKIIQNAYAEAEKCIEKALGINPNDGDAWESMASIKIEQKAYAEAENCFKKTLELNPNDGNSWRELGHIKEEQGVYEEAEIYYKKAIEIDDSDILAWGNLGLLNAKRRNNFIEAKRCFDNILKKDPKSIELYENYNNMLILLIGRKKGRIVLSIVFLFLVLSIFFLVLSIITSS